MPKRSWLAVSGAYVLLTALLIGLLYFAGLASPASYSDLSSLNSGPQGAKLLFDALTSIPSLTVSRNYLPLSEWRPNASTILFLAVKPNSLNRAAVERLEELERLSRSGSRVVLGITDEPIATKGDAKVLLKRWGVRLISLPNDDEDEPELSLARDRSWHEIEGAKDAWEKHFGAGGTVVIALHAGQFSNESVAADKTVQALIPPLIAGNTTVVFEETHLGIEESGSVAGLARRYRLQGLAAGLLLVAVLFVWNRSVSFPPPPRFAAGAEARVSGADARAIFASLIARHLTPQALMESCVAEWNRVRPRNRLALPAQSKLEPVSTYRLLQQNVHSKRNRI